MTDHKSILRRRLKVLTNLSLLLFICVKCQPDTASNPVPVKKSWGLNSSEPLNTEQIDSLKAVFYVGNPMPKPVTTKEISFIQSLKKSDPNSLKRLEELYLGNLSLMALAIRDTDSDGIPDYRVSDVEFGVKYLGKFYAGDPDIDGDGISNVFDRLPYTKDKNTQDTNKNGIIDVNGKDVLPEHLVFQKEKYSDEMIKIQSQIFEEAGIALVEKTQVFSEKLIYVTRDVLLNAYQSWFEGSKKLKSLRVISTDEYALLNASVDDKTEGVYNSHDQTLTIFSEGQSHSSFLLFGLLSHELAHAYHYAMDFHGRLLESSSASLPRTRFEKLMSGFGWELIKENSTPYAQELYRGHWQDGSTEYSASTYMSKSGSDWDDLLIEAELESALIDSLSKNFILGSYAMSHPHEYYADAMMGYVLLQLERTILDQPESIQKVRKEVLNAYGDFRYWFLLGGHSLESVIQMTDAQQKISVPLYYHFSKLIPIPEDTRQILFEQYFEEFKNQ